VIDRILCRLFNRRYRYRLSMTYHCKNSSNKGTIWGSLDSECRSDLLNDRDIKVIGGPMLIKKVPRHMLDNGKISIDNISYLGWF
jgi:hypothetical protein